MLSFKRGSEVLEIVILGVRGVEQKNFTLTITRHDPHTTDLIFTLIDIQHSLEFPYVMHISDWL